MRYCPYCGKEVAEGSNFCPYCAKALSGDSQCSEKSKNSTLILCCLGLVSFAGLHRLYVGKIISGILYLFTLGFFFIGTIIDIFNILDGTFTDGAGLVIRR